MKIRNIAAIAFVLIISIGCNEEAPCYDFPLPTLTLDDDFGCERTTRDMEIDLSEEFIVIKDQATFDSLVSVYCDPLIDFSTHDFLIGKKGLTKGLATIDYQLTDKCDQLNHDLKVSIGLAVTDEAPNITYHCLVPKLKDDQSVNVEVEVYHY